MSKVGDIIVVRKFLLLPLKLNGDKHWLKTVNIIYVAEPVFGLSWVEKWFNDTPIEELKNKINFINKNNSFDVRSATQKEFELYLNSCG
jgi:hypothetical protein